jgi:hypothetical protein
VAACEGVEFVTDTITIACSADRTCEVAKAMEITFALDHCFLNASYPKCGGELHACRSSNQQKQSLSSSSSLSTCCGLVKTGDGGTETQAESIAGVHRLRSSKRRFQMTLSCSWIDETTGINRAGAGLLLGSRIGFEAHDELARTASGSPHLFGLTAGLIGGAIMGRKPTHGTRKDRRGIRANAHARAADTRTQCKRSKVI